MHSRSVGVMVPGWLHDVVGVNSSGVREGLVFAVHVDGVDSKPIDTSFKPEPHGRVVDGVTRGLVLPV